MWVQAAVTMTPIKRLKHRGGVESSQDHPGAADPEIQRANSGPVVGDHQPAAGHRAADPAVLAAGPAVLAKPPTDPLNSDPTNPANFPPWFVQGLQNFGIGNDLLAHDPLLDTPWIDLVSNILQNFGINWDPAGGTVNGLDYDAYTDPSHNALVGRSIPRGALRIFNSSASTYCKIRSRLSST